MCSLNYSLTTRGRRRAGALGGRPAVILSWTEELHQSHGARPSVLVSGPPSLAPVHLVLHGRSLLRVFISDSVFHSSMSLPGGIFFLFLHFEKKKTQRNRIITLIR